MKYSRFISKVEQNTPVSFCYYDKKKLIVKTPDYKALTMITIGEIMWVFQWNGVCLWKNGYWKINNKK